MTMTRFTPDFTGLQAELQKLMRAAYDDGRRAAIDSLLAELEPISRGSTVYTAADIVLLVRRVRSEL